MSKEWKIGKHRAVLDEENNALVVNIEDDFESEDVEDYIDVVNEAFPGVVSGRHVIILFSKGSKGGIMTKEAREALKKKFEENKGANKDRIAIVGASPAVRMISKVIIKVTGSVSTKFFKTKEEAFQWFKEG